MHYLISLDKFGASIKKIRKEHLKVSQTELAKASGIDFKTLSRIELEKVDPTLETMQKLLAGVQSYSKEAQDSFQFSVWENGTI